jgi:hypothetical protein
MNSTLRILVLSSVGLVGCVATSPQWDAGFGDSARQLRAAQTLDRNATTRNTAPPVIDSKATAGAQTNYSTSYGYAIKEAKPPAITLVPQGQ